jgi:hypothetical protein
LAVPIRDHESRERTHRPVTLRPAHHVCRSRPDENARYEFWVGSTCFAIWQPAQFGVEYQPQANSIVLLHVEDVPAARAELEAKGVQFQGETFDTGVCHMANFADLGGNPLTLHRVRATSKTQT